MEAGCGPHRQTCAAVLASLAGATGRGGAVLVLGGTAATSSAAVAGRSNKGRKRRQGEAGLRLGSGRSQTERFNHYADGSGFWVRPLPSSLGPSTPFPSLCANGSSSLSPRPPPPPPLPSRPPSLLPRLRLLSAVP